MAAESFVCLCTQRDGKLKLFDRDGFDRALRRFGEGEDLELEISRPRRSRTRKQEKFFHGPVLAGVMDVTGYTQTEAKIEMCLLFIPVEHLRPDGSVVVLPGSTSTLTVEDYNDRLIEPTIQWLAEHGYIVKDAQQWLADQRHALRKGAA